MMSEENVFWNGFSISQLHKFYFYVPILAKYWVSLLNFWRVILVKQSPAVYISNMQNEQVQHFLHFTTGSTVLIDEKICQQL